MNEVNEPDDSYMEVRRKKGADTIRVLVFLLIATVMLVGSTPLAVAVGEPSLAVIGMWMAGATIAVACTHVFRRLLFPYLDLRNVAQKACKSPTGAGLTFLGVCLVLAALLLSVSPARAQGVPPGAVKYMPVLISETMTYWPGADIALFASQTEQESCISLKHSKCWTPFAELKTSRERGVGFGQITKTAKMDALTELRGHFPQELRGWDWDSARLYDPALQFRGLVLKNKQNYQRITGAATEEDRIAMMLIAYNGGSGRVISDRKMCQATPGCDPSKWFGHAEKTTRLAKVALPGYGKSFYEINREYPKLVMVTRKPKYVTYLASLKKA
jgi:hypothetical protein